jgi:rsbT co-antagonist protein RsbR
MVGEEEREQLQRRIAELEGRVAQLEVKARRFEAIEQSPIMGMFVADAATRPVLVSRGWELMWQTPGEAVIGSGYSLLGDAQSIEKGLVPYIERALKGESLLLPLIDYDPKKHEFTDAGARTVQWFMTVVCPVKDASGEVRELVLLEHDVSELQEIKLRNEELMAEQRQLSASLQERNRDLEEKLAFIEAQQDAINKMSVPVIQVWDGILVLPLVGMVNDTRAERILETLLSAITEREAWEVIVDITGVPTLDAQAANALMRAVAAARLLGAACTLSGVSPSIAQTLITLDVDLGTLETCGALEEGLKRAIRRRGQAR